MALLSESEITDGLRDIAGWGSEKNEIIKEYKFKNFVESIGFVNKVSILAEKWDHHPDILIRYNKVNIVLSTHSEGGVTVRDLALAREIEDIA